MFQEHYVTESFYVWLLNYIIESCFPFECKLQVVRLREVFPHGSMIVMVFEYMLSDLSEVIRKSERPLTEAQVKSYMLMLFKGLAFLHDNNIMHRVNLIFE